jgi:HYDIN/CFA65/VesB family protein
MMRSETTGVVKGKIGTWLGATLITAIMALISLTATALYSFGSFGSALSYLRGDHLIADAYAKSFGILRKGETSCVVFQLRNMSKEPIKLLGARTSCTCVTIDGVPTTIEPETVSPLKVFVHSDTLSSRYEERISFFTDMADQPSVTLRIFGIIREETSDSSSSK